VERVLLVNVARDVGLAGGCDPADQVVAHRDRHVLRDLAAQARGRSDRQCLVAGLREQDRGGVDVEHLADVRDQLA